MKVRTVATLTVSDSVGKVVDVIPVRAWSAGQLNAAGHPAQPVDIEEVADTGGMPIRYVASAVDHNLAGVPLDVMSVRGDTGGDGGGPGSPIGLLLALTKAA